MIRDVIAQQEYLDHAGLTPRWHSTFQNTRLNEVYRHDSLGVVYIAEAALDPVLVLKDGLILIFEANHKFLSTLDVVPFW